MVSQTPDYNGARLAFWKNNGDGTFSDATSGNIPQPWNAWSGDWIYRVHIADFNGDGWKDVLTSRHLFINEGGTFTDLTGTVTGLHQKEPELRDYSTFLAYPIDADGNGSQDILIVRGWYLYEEDEVTPAVILRNMN